MSKNKPVSTTDRMLSDVRRYITRWEQTPPWSREESEAAEHATRAMAELDAALAAGARLPAAWEVPTAEASQPRGRHVSGFARLPGTVPAKPRHGVNQPARLSDEELVHAVLSVTSPLVAGTVQRRIAELKEQITELNARLDRTESTGLVLHCLERDAETAMTTSTHEDPGTILRATDTSRSWQLGEDRKWTPRG